MKMTFDFKVISKWFQSDFKVQLSASSWFFEDAENITRTPEIACVCSNDPDQMIAS